MTWRVLGQRGPVGEEWARLQLFGPDRAEATNLARFRGNLLGSVDHARRSLEGAVSAVRREAVTDRGERVIEDVASRLLECLKRLDGAQRAMRDRDVEKPFRVVLMGRTMAGKSSLFEYLSNGDGSRVGDGSQGYSKDNCAREVPDAGFEIVDTPGVGKMDGEDDYATAFTQVADADLILWVATDQATQEKTGQALERLADLGKPILVVLNCLADLTDEINLLDLLEEPERIFGGDAEGNLAPIRRHLAHAGGRYVDAVAVHAQAALLAESGEFTGDEAKTLCSNSRIDVLLGVLREQRDRTATARRTVSITDVLRTELLDVLGAIREQVRLADISIEVTNGAIKDFRARAERRIDDAHGELRAAFTVAIGSRERWVESVDVDQAANRINAEWAHEVDALESELEKATEQIAEHLARDLAQIADDVASDWAAFDPGNFKDLGGRGVAWGNRAVRVGGRFAAALGAGALGVKLGALIGTVIPLPPGINNAVGAAIGGLLAFVGTLLGSNKLIDKVADLLPSTTTVRKRRRQKVREQFVPLLAQIKTHADSTATDLRREWTEAVSRDAEQQAEFADALRRVREALAGSYAELDALLGDMDTALARELLRDNGRTRVADAITRATRWRGAGMAVELTEPGFSELVLFPVDDTVERFVPTSAATGSGTAALQVVRHLTDAFVNVHTMNLERLDVSLDTPMRVGVREAWQALAQVHAGIEVSIRNTVEGAAG
jgi:small GTP-binding protein